MYVGTFSILFYIRAPPPPPPHPRPAIYRSTHAQVKVQTASACDFCGGSTCVFDHMYMPAPPRAHAHAQQAKPKSSHITAGISSFVW